MSALSTRESARFALRRAIGRIHEQVAELNEDVDLEVGDRVYFRGDVERIDRHHERVLVTLAGEERVWVDFGFFERRPTVKGPHAPTF